MWFVGKKGRPFTSSRNTSLVLKETISKTLDNGEAIIASLSIKEFQRKHARL